MKLDFKKVAFEAAAKAGGIHKQSFGKKIKITQKESAFDLVTDTDLKAEKVITALIKKNFPSHNIIAEEGKYLNTASEYSWVIDPLDGTNNFAFGIPIFCVSIALAKKGEVILGVIYDSLRDEFFWAEKGRGAYLNQKKISVSRKNSLKESLLITGFYYNRGKEMENNLKIIKLFFQKKIIGLRRLGAAALDLSYVACGRACGFWEFNLSSWDFAAGKIIIEEAGGLVTGKKNETLELKNSYVVASNKKIHPEMIKIINSI